MRTQNTIHENPISANHYKGILPTVFSRQPRDGERREDGSEVGAGVEDAGGKRSLFLWKPFGSCLNRGREVSRLSEAEKCPCRTII